MLITELLEIKNKLLASKKQLNNSKIAGTDKTQFMNTLVRTTYDAIVNLQDEYGLADDEHMNKLMNKIHESLVEQEKLYTGNMRNVEMTATKL